MVLAEHAAADEFRRKNPRHVPKIRIHLLRYQYFTLPSSRSDLSCFTKNETVKYRSPNALHACALSWWRCLHSQVGAGHRRGGSRPCARARRKRRRFPNWQSKGASRGAYVCGLLWFLARPMIYGVAARDKGAGAQKPLEESPRKGLSFGVALWQEVGTGIFFS